MTTTSQKVSHNTKDKPLQDENSEWFEDMVAKLRVDLVELAAGIASREKADIYNSMINNDVESMLYQSKKLSSQYYISKLLQEFYNQLIHRNAKIKSLHVYHNSTCLQVWSLVSDEDGASRSSIYLSEAFVNSKYYDKGYSVDAMVVEESDNIKAPNHFKILVG